MPNWGRSKRSALSWGGYFTKSEAGMLHKEHERWGQEHSRSMHAAGEAWDIDDSPDPYDSTRASPLQN